MTSPRQEILQAAIDLTTGPRAKSHGPVQANLGTAGTLFRHWKEACAKDLGPGTDSAISQVMTKLSRIACGSTNKDDFVDGAAYFGIAWECLEVLQPYTPAQAPKDPRDKVLVPTRTEEQYKVYWYDINTQYWIEEGFANNSEEAWRHGELPPLHLILPLKILYNGDTMFRDSAKDHYLAEEGMRPLPFSKLYKQLIKTQPGLAPYQLTRLNG